MLNQSAQSLQLGRLGSLRGDSAHRRELTGVQVHYLLDLLTAFPIKAVEAALALAPGVSGFYELRNYVRIPVHVPVRITFRETGQHALAHLRYEIQAHQVYQAKDPGLGSPCGTAQDCVRLLYPIPVSRASANAACIQKEPTRLAMKPGVSLHLT